MTMYPCNRSIIEVLLLHVSFMMLDHAQATTATAMSIAPNPIQQKDQLNMIECIEVETTTKKCYAFGVDSIIWCARHKNTGE